MTSDEPTYGVQFLHQLEVMECTIPFTAKQIQEVSDFSQENLALWMQRESRESAEIVRQNTPEAAAILIDERRRQRQAADSTVSGIWCGFCVFMELLICL